MATTTTPDDLRTRLTGLIAESPTGDVQVRLTTPDGPVSGRAYLRSAAGASWRPVGGGVMLQFDGGLPGELSIFDRALIARLEIESPDGEWRPAERRC